MRKEEELTKKQHLPKEEREEEHFASTTFLLCSEEINFRERRERKGVDFRITIYWQREGEGEEEEEKHDIGDCTFTLSRVYMNNINQKYDRKQRIHSRPTTTNKKHQHKQPNKE